MTRRERLQDNYEDALFALLMEDWIEEAGERLTAENRWLKNDPSAAIPEKLDQRCRKLIRHGAGAASARKTGQTIARVTFRTFSKAAAVIVICMLLFTAAFAVSPALRMKTLNLLVGASNLNATLIVDDSSQPQANYDTSEAALTVYEQFGYRIPAMPDGFELTSTTVSPNLSLLRYNTSDGTTINFRFTKTLNGNYQVDTENAQRVEPISVNGFDGMLIEKDNWLSIVWANTETDVFVHITAAGIDEAELLSIAGVMTSEP